VENGGDKYPLIDSSRIMIIMSNELSEDQKHMLKEDLKKDFKEEFMEEL
jgi:hypothetical protein